MGLNLFIAVVCVVVALLLTFLTIRFFFGAEARAADAESGAFRDQPEQEPVHAGDTLRTRRSDNAASVRLLTAQVIVAAVLTLLVVIPDLLHLMNPSMIPGWLIAPWLQAIIITPVMFYSGYPIHIDGWSAIRRRVPNMNSLAAVGATAAYVYSLLVCFAEDVLPDSMHDVYFQVTGVLITLVLLARLMSDRWLPRRAAFPLQTKVNRLSRVLVPVVFLIAVWTFVVWMILGRQPAFARALLMGIDVLIIACPVALGWAAPLAATFATDRARRTGMRVLTTSALQQAKDVRAVVISSALADASRETIDALLDRGMGVDVIATGDADDAVRLIDERRARLDIDGATAALMFVGDGSEDVAVRNAADIAVVVTKDADATFRHADVVTDTAGCSCVPPLIRLSKAMVRNIQENLVWAFVFNLIGIPIAAGVLYPFTGWTLDPSLAGLAMFLSSLAVLLNALRLRRAHIDR
ncbi:ATPase P [Bifidobacterium italicum]|uniref:ATPase P n=1 Tax=Bifidobacterium italicum TaxID=1960968 RepID=A0A2A2EL72_9BIFI|nr:ATPase P [Bifidobacterium italicum]PAU69747.1 ATPase P [Bifidobacterium italicum]